MPCAYPGARDAPVEERVDPLSYRCRAACRSRRSTSCAPSSAGRQNDRRRGRARSSGCRRRRRGSRRSRHAPSRALCWPARACPGQARLAQLQVLGAQVEALEDEEAEDAETDASRRPRRRRCSSSPSPSAPGRLWSLIRPEMRTNMLVASSPWTFRLEPGGRSIAIREERALSVAWRPRRTPDTVP